MMKAATDSPQRTRGGMSTSWMVALAIAFGITTIPATTQAAPPQPQERLCTGGFNTDYGWFFNAAELMSAIEVPGINSACINATGAGLKVQLGGLDLPLVEAMTYDYSSSPPRLQVPLLEPALCEDYTSAGSQSGALKLMLKDANGVQMFPSGSLIDSMAYSLSSGLLKPRGAGVSKIRCHSALSPNFAIVPPVQPGPNFIFEDGLEEWVDLQLEFLDVLGNPLGNNSTVLEQAAGGDVTFQVRVKNIGNQFATDVRIREFVPKTSALLMPVVTRVSCVDESSQAPCNGSNELRADISALPPDAERIYTLTRKSAGTDTSNGQSMALVQVAVFSDESNGGDAEYKNNSRTLRIKVVNQTQVTRGIRTDGVAGGAGGSIAVGTALPSGCSTVGQVTTCPPSTSGLEFIATATSGYTFTGFTGCVGSSSNVTDTTGTFTTTTSASCTLTANFHKMPTVTASVSGSNGTISPSSQAIHYSEAAEFIVTPSAGYEVHEINGCGGVTYVSGQTSQTWTTGPITSGCAVTASFKASSYTVTVNVGANGAVTSTNPYVITYPLNQAVFTALPNPNYKAEIASTSTCATDGPLPNLFGPGVMFSAESVTADCEIDLEFSLVTYPVTANPDVVNGKIWFLDAGNQVSDTDIDVPHGHTASFNLIPDPGFTFANPAYVTATGCTVDSVNYNTATQIWSAVTSAITANGCVISATFTPE